VIDGMFRYFYFYVRFEERKWRQHESV
jgi:hypothetical protein